MIFDIIILGIMALCILLGYVRGLINVAVRILGFIIAIVVALILYIPISNYVINNTNLVTNIQEVVKSKVNKEDNKVEEDDENSDSNFAVEIEKYVNNSVEEVKNNSIEFLSKEIAIAIVRGGTWIALFVLVRIIMIFVKILAKVIEKIPVIKQFNKVRWNNIWSIRRSYNNLYCTCSYKYSVSNNKR